LAPWREILFGSGYARLGCSEKILVLTDSCNHIALPPSLSLKLPLANWSGNLPVRSRRQSPLMRLRRLKSMHSSTMGNASRMV